MNGQAPIINRPDLQSRRRRAVLGLVGFVGWILWIYLWLPFATFGGWIFGGFLFRKQLVDQGLGGYFVTILSYLGVIILLSVIFLGWALYNRARFRGRERRKPRPPVGDAEIAMVFGIECADLQKLREADRAVLHFSPEGQIIQIESPLPPFLLHPSQAESPAGIEIS